MQRYNLIEMAPLQIHLMGFSALLGDAVAQSQQLSLRLLAEKCIHIRDGLLCRRTKAAKVEPAIELLASLYKRNQRVA